jgi:hypothetical protein
VYLGSTPSDGTTFMNTEEIEKFNKAVVDAPGSAQRALIAYIGARDPYGYFAPEAELEQQLFPAEKLAGSTPAGRPNALIGVQFPEGKPLYELQNGLLFRYDREEADV